MWAGKDPKLYHGFGEPVSTLKLWDLQPSAMSTTWQRPRRSYIVEVASALLLSDKTFSYLIPGQSRRPMANFVEKYRTSTVLHGGVSPYDTSISSSKCATASVSRLRRFRLELNPINFVENGWSRRTRLVSYRRLCIFLCKDCQYGYENANC
ncbi:hypothetical protein CC80DRAFT_495770 [Byssothecium circinans]|uniref:Uncharacterized protein n=1 Tax=Byssothecium circinans TaxID=147558 RepID=A0A6A5THP1_9PLEO|nr:hypothetical protein CC80DRAFT_495770 [Byssothecium circinans]